MVNLENEINPMRREKGREKGVPSLPLVLSLLALNINPYSLLYCHCL
jgi:hypothetical protein